LTSFRAGCYGPGRRLCIAYGGATDPGEPLAGIAASVVYRFRGIDAGDAAA